MTFYYNESPPAPGHATTPSSAPAADHPAASLLAMTASHAEQQLGTPTLVDGFRWTSTTAAGVLRVYFNDARIVVDVQPPGFDVSLVNRAELQKWRQRRPPVFLAVRWIRRCLHTTYVIGTARRRGSTRGSLVPKPTGQIRSPSPVIGNDGDVIKRARRRDSHVRSH